MKKLTAISLAVLVAAALLCALGAPHRPARAAPDLIPVTVNILRFIEMGQPDLWDGLMFGDYYARVKIGEYDADESEVKDGNPDYGMIGPWDFEPYWTFTKEVDTSDGSIEVVIEIIDDDLINDDIIDIDPDDDDTSLTLQFDLLTGEWSGDVPTGVLFSRGDGDADHFGAGGSGEPGMVFFDISFSDDGDLDDDGIPDGVERYGIYDAAGNLEADMNALGANPCRQSVAIEVDYMDGATDGHTHQPDAAAIQEAQAVFNDSSVSPNWACRYPDYSLVSGADLLIDVDEAIPEQTVIGWAEFEDIRDHHFDPDRRPYFHYAVFAHHHSMWIGSGGVCCRDRKDYIVSLGSFTDAAVGSNQNGTPRQQAAALIHELGHSLGLGHGGGDGVNWKPNYLSIMNYRWAYSGLFNSQTGVATLDFSRRALDPLNELDLDETAGIGDGITLTAWRDLNYNLLQGPGNGRCDWTGDDADGNWIRDDDTGVAVDISADRVCIRAGSDGILDSTTSEDDVIVGDVIWDGDNRTCDSSLSGDDEYDRGRKLGHTQVDILTGYDDWSNLKYRGAMSASAAAPTPEPHIELTYEEVREMEAYWEAYLSVEAGPDQYKDEGAMVSLELATFIDPGPVADTHTATIDWGDGTVSNGAVTEYERSGSVAGSHVYADDGMYTVTVTVCDDDGDCASGSLSVIVANVAPSLGAVTDLNVNELDTVNLPVLQFSDPGFDCPDCSLPTQEDFGATIDWGDGTIEAGTVVETPGSAGNPTTGTVQGTHVYGDNGVFDVTVTIVDDDGGAADVSFQVVVDNVAPTPEIDTAGTAVVHGVPTWIVHAGVSIDFSGRATDPGSDDITLSWDWDDGLPSPDVETVYLVNPPDPDPMPSPSIQPRDVTDNRTHTFGDACHYLVSFRADDDDLGHAADSGNVVILGNAELVRSAGYWLHQYSQRGKTDFSPPALQCFLDIVGNMSRVFDEETNASTIDLAYDVLYVHLNQGTITELLEQQLLAAWLNFANGAVEYDQLIDTDGDGVEDTAFYAVVNAAEDVRLDPGATREQLEAQKDVLERINVMDEGVE